MDRHRLRPLISLGALALSATVVAGCGGAEPAARTAIEQHAPTQARPSASASGLSATTTAKASKSALPWPIPAPAVQPEPCPPPPSHGGGGGGTWTPPTPAVKLNRVPFVKNPKPWRADLTAVSGKGMWVTNWASSHVDVPKLIAKAKAAHLTSIWVRTGGTKQGWYGTRILTELLPAAHAAGLKVIAWDFPMLSNPMKDRARAHTALTFRVKGQRIDGFSPDIETINEGTFNTPRRVRFYLAKVRADAGTRPVIATVMRPTHHQLATYPYAAEAPFVDAFAPMVYWSCHEPGGLTAASIHGLAKFGKPVAPIGQAYDMADEGGRPGIPTGAETWRFLDVAKRDGAIGASLWTYEEAGAGQWKALRAYPWPSR